MDEPQRPARGARGRRRPRALRLPRPVDRAAAPVPRSPTRPDRRARRPDAHRRGPRLPVGRARPARSAAAAATSTTPTGEWVSETEVIETAVRARRALQPGRHLRRVRRGRPRGGRAAGRADRRGRPARGRPASRPRRRVVARRGPVRRRRRLVGRRPARCSLTEDDDESAARRLYDLALEFQERSQRTEARLIEQFEGAVGRPGLGHRRPDHRRRRRRAARR